MKFLFTATKYADCPPFKVTLLHVMVALMENSFEKLKTTSQVLKAFTMFFFLLLICCLFSFHFIKYILCCMYACWLPQCLPACRPAIRSRPRTPHIKEEIIKQSVCGRVLLLSCKFFFHYFYAINKSIATTTKFHITFLVTRIHCSRHWK